MFGRVGLLCYRTETKKRHCLDRDLRSAGLRGVAGGDVSFGDAMGTVHFFLDEKEGPSLLHLQPGHALGRPDVDRFSHLLHQMIGINQDLVTDCCDP